MAAILSGVVASGDFFVRRLGPAAGTPEAHNAAPDSVLPV
nr:K372 [uncultured bacterium]